MKIAVIMKASLRAYLDGLRAFPAFAQSHPQSYFSRPGKDFTRCTKLHLDRLTWLVASLIKSSCCVQLDRFFSDLKPCLPKELKDIETPTGSALTQARQKIKPTYFRELFQLSSALFYKLMHVKKWKGLRLWAADGTGIKLPEILALSEVFGEQKNQHGAVPSTRAFVIFDVLNEIAVAVQFHKSTTSECTVANQSVPQIPKDVCMIYDRAYTGQVLPYLHQQYGSHCIVRQTTSCSNTIKTFVESGKKEEIVTEKLTTKSKSTLAALGFEVTSQTTITYRLVRVELSTGEVEVLLTTLADTKKFKHEYFSELYHKRWGVETFFFVIKSWFQLFNFSAQCENNLWQDLYAPFIFYNMQTCIIGIKARKIKQINKNRELDYKPNRNVTGGLLQQGVIKIMFGAKKMITDWLNGFYRIMIQTMEPIRPDRVNERKKRTLRSTERHIHEKNYRSAL